jgi:hypothetical protein
VRPNGTSSRRAQEQLTTAAPARATSAASAGEMTLCAIGVRLTPPCVRQPRHTPREARAAPPRTHPARAQAQLASQPQAAQLAAGVATHVRLVQLRTRGWRQKRALRDYHSHAQMQTRLPHAERH